MAEAIDIDIYQFGLDIVPQNDDTKYWISNDGECARCTSGVNEAPEGFAEVDKAAHATFVAESKVKAQALRAEGLAEGDKREAAKAEIMKRVGFTDEDLDILLGDQRPGKAIKKG